MKKKLFFKFFIFAVLTTFVTFTACKDYDDDIDKLETGLANLESTVKNLQQKIEGGSTITGVETIANGVTIKISDGKTYTITNGADGKDGSVITIGENGNWFINGEDTNKPSKGADGNDGTDGKDGIDGKDGTDGKDGVDGKNGIYYIPSEDGFWHKVDGDVVTPTTDRWMIEATITAKWEDGYVVLYNVEGAEEPITIGLVGMNNLVLIPHHVTKDGSAVLNFSTLITSDEGDILQATAQYQVSPTNTSEKLIDKDNLYFKYNSIEVVTYSTGLNPKAEFVSLENGILTVTASIDAASLEQLEEDGKKIIQLMLVVPSTSGDEVVSDFVKVVSVGLEEVESVLTVTPETLEMFTEKGGDVTFTIDSNGGEWEVSELPDWLIQKEKTATALTLTVAPNVGEVRTASVTFHLVAYPTVTKVVEVAQAEFVAPPILEVPAAQDGLSVSFDGGNIKIDVASNFNWTYTIEDNSWLTEVSKTDTDLELTAAANDGAQRMTKVIITTESTPALTKEVVITQLEASTSRLFIPITSENTTGRDISYVTFHDDGSATLLANPEDPDQRTLSIKNENFGYGKYTAVFSNLQMAPEDVNLTMSLNKVAIRQLELAWGFRTRQDFGNGYKLQWRRGRDWVSADYPNARADLDSTMPMDNIKSISIDVKPSTKSETIDVDFYLNDVLFTSIEAADVIASLKAANEPLFLNFWILNSKPGSPSSLTTKVYYEPFE